MGCTGVPRVAARPQSWALFLCPDGASHGSPFLYRNFRTPVSVLTYEQHVTIIVTETTRRSMLDIHREFPLSDTTRFSIEALTDALDRKGLVISFQTDDCCECVGVVFAFPWQTLSQLVSQCRFTLSKKDGRTTVILAHDEQPTTGLSVKTVQTQWGMGAGHSNA